MQKYENSAWNSTTGLPIAEPTIEVRHAGTGTTATIYSDDGVTPKSNPFLGDTVGRFSFYAPTGRYDIIVTKTGVTSYTITDVSLTEPRSGGYELAHGVDVQALLANALHDRVTNTWHRRHTARPAWRVETDSTTSNDYFRALHALAGANPITWTELWRLDGTGQMQLGGNIVIGGTLAHTGTAVGFYAKTPVPIADASDNLTDNSGGTADDNIEFIPDPADDPATADDLRDDLVANLIPELRNNFADLTAKVNKALTVLRDVGLMDT
jgi:hypothetical protein